MRQRRRAERQFSARPAADEAVSRRVNERQVQYLLYWIGAGLALLLVTVVLAGWYFSSFKPPRKTVAEAGGQHYQLRQLVPYTKLEGFGSGRLQPDLALNTLVRSELIVERGHEIGASVTPEQVEKVLVTRFQPVPTNPATDPPARLTGTGQELLTSFVEALGVSETEYRVWLEHRLWQDAALEHFLQSASKTADQVFVEWIVAADSVQAQVAFDRVAAGEPFKDVAKELNTDSALSDEGGRVGWVPRGALPEIEPIIFAESLGLGEPIGPLATRLGSIVIRITDGPSEQPMTDVMRDLVAQDAFLRWVAVQAKDLTFDLSTEDIQWVLRQVSDT